METIKCPNCGNEFMGIMYMPCKCHDCLTLIVETCGCLENKKPKNIKKKRANSKIINLSDKIKEKIT